MNYEDDRASGSFSAGDLRSLFKNLVGLSIRSTANQIGDRFPVSIILEIDEHPISVTPQTSVFKKITETLNFSQPNDPEPLRLIIRLRHCYIRYDCKDVSVLVDSKYRSALTSGKYSRETTEHLMLNSDNQSSSSIGFSGGFNGKANVKIDGSLSAGRKRADERRSGDVTTIEPELYEVDVVPNGWKVGDRTYGDPLKDGGCLSGRYFGREGSESNYSCLLEFADDAISGEILFRVTTRDGLIVQRLDGSTATGIERSLVEQSMRDRLASLRLEVELNGEASSVNDSEVTLAAIRCHCSRIKDLEG